MKNIFLGQIIQYKKVKDCNLVEITYNSEITRIDPAIEFHIPNDYASPQIESNYNSWKPEAISRTLVIKYLQVLFVVPQDGITRTMEFESIDLRDFRESIENVLDVEVFKVKQPVISIVEYFNGSFFYLKVEFCNEIEMESVSLIIDNSDFSVLDCCKKNNSLYSKFILGQEAAEIQYSACKRDFIYRFTGTIREYNNCKIVFDRHFNIIIIDLFNKIELERSDIRLDSKNFEILEEKFYHGKNITRLELILKSTGEEDKESLGILYIKEYSYNLFLNVFGKN